MPVLQEEVHRWIVVASVEAPPTQDNQVQSDGGWLQDRRRQSPRASWTNALSLGSNGSSIARPAVTVKVIPEIRLYESVPNILWTSA